MIDRWKEAWADPKFRWVFVISSSFASILLALSPVYMNFIESRPGVFMNDYLLNKIPPKDVSGLIMAILYCSLITALCWLCMYPRKLVIAVTTFFLTILLRYICIFIFALEAPLGLIPLKDPFLELVVYEGNIITKDLFFSGHATTMCIIYLCVDQKVLRPIYLIGCIILCGLLLLQHIHYSTDVFAAVFITWGIYTIVKRRLEI